MLAHLALYTTLSLFVQSPAATPAKPREKVPPCSVSGRVVTAAEGNPLKSARVILVPEQRGEASAQLQVYSALSDSDGRFVVKNIPAGRYQFSAKRTGYVDQLYQIQ
jgi:Carboxypeptidase regulatory-like domain